MLDTYWNGENWVTPILFLNSINTLWSHDISGANTGIGFETAFDLAKRGARVILLCRNEDKAKKAAQEIKSLYQEAQLTIRQLDLASLKSVRTCAQTLIDTEDKIDILVNNAGKSFQIFLCLSFSDTSRK